MEFGDIAFFGNGPDNVLWWIGIEYKTIDDVVACIKSGRFTGTQLPGMLRTYDICFLLVEGIARPDRERGQLVRYRGKATYGCGIQYAAYDNYLTAVNVFSSLYGKPCIVKTAGTDFETGYIIRDIYNLFQKRWEDHHSISKPDQTKIQRVSYDLEVIKIEPGDAEYPAHWLRKSLYQIQGVGWEVAGKLADHFGTMEVALAANVKDWLALDHVGAGLAKRAYYALHGYEDPTIIRRKKKTMDILP